MKHLGFNQLLVASLLTALAVAGKHSSKANKVTTAVNATEHELSMPVHESSSKAAKAPSEDLNGAQMSTPMRVHRGSKSAKDPSKEPSEDEMSTPLKAHGRSKSSKEAEVSNEGEMSTPLAEDGGSKSAKVELSMQEGSSKSEKVKASVTGGKGGKAGQDMSVPALSMYQSSSKSGKGSKASGVQGKHADVDSKAFKSSKAEVDAKAFKTGKSGKSLSLSVENHADVDSKAFKSPSVGVDAKALKSGKAGKSLSLSLEYMSETPSSAPSSAPSMQPNANPTTARPTGNFLFGAKTSKLFKPKEDSSNEDATDALFEAIFGNGDN
jgi:hypothetical protein